MGNKTLKREGVHAGIRRCDSQDKNNLKKSEIILGYVENVLYISIVIESES